MLVELNKYVKGSNYYYDIYCGDGCYRGYAASIQKAVEDAEAYASLCVFPHIELFRINGSLIRSWDLE